jgi:hypothetical protein
MPRQLKDLNLLNPCVWPQANPRDLKVLASNLLNPWAWLGARPKDLTRLASYILNPWAWPQANPRDLKGFGPKYVTSLGLA